MKFLKSILIAVFIMAAFSLCTQVLPVAMAADYTLALTTNTPTGSATLFTNGAFPNITGGAYIRGLIIANRGDALQEISVYDTCTSSTAASLAGMIVVGSSTTVTLGADQIPAQIWKLTNPGFIKSSTSSTVQITVLYQ